MAKTREEKQKSIKHLKEELSKQKAMVFIDFSGLNAKTLFGLRDELKKNNCQLTIVKKNLFKKALESQKLTAFLEKIDQVKGQLALIFGFADEISAAKICQKTAQNNENLQILGGSLENVYQDKEKIIALAELPSKQQLLAKLTGALKAPQANFVYVLKANIKGLVSVLSQIKK